jgi:hypothetical protein
MACSGYVISDCQEGSTLYTQTAATWRTNTSSKRWRRYGKAPSITCHLRSLLSRRIRTVRTTSGPWGESFWRCIADEDFGTAWKLCRSYIWYAFPSFCFFIFIFRWNVLSANISSPPAASTRLEGNSSDSRGYPYLPKRSRFHSKLLTNVSNRPLPVRAYSLTLGVQRTGATDNRKSTQTPPLRSRIAREQGIPVCLQSKTEGD